MSEIINSLIQTVCIRDMALGFFIGLALRRGRIEAIFDRWLPASYDDESASEDE